MTRKKKTNVPEKRLKAISKWLKERVDEAFADGAKSIPAKVVFKRLRARHARSVRQRSLRKAPNVNSD